MGQLIIFEGLDGSGKGTQTKLTAQRLKEQGRELRQITFQIMTASPRRSSKCTYPARSATSPTT